MKKVYVAGPYSADNIIQVLSNIRNGIETAVGLIHLGHAVFCPHLDFLFALVMGGESLTKEQFQANSMAWVEVSDVVYVMPGSEKSNGVKREVERAQSLKIPVVYEARDI